MEGEGVEIRQEVNHTDAAKDKGGTESAQGGDAKAGRKRKQRELPSPTSDRLITSDRPTRERKSIERFIVSPDKEIKEFKILKGTGTALKDIPNVVFKLSKRKGSDEAVQALHKVMFGKISAKHTAKANILRFSGFVWSGGNEEKERAKVREKLEKLVKEILYQMSDILDLNLSKSMKKEDTALKVLEFLESPHKTTEKLVEEKAKSKKSKKAKKTRVKGAKKGHTPVKSPKGMKKTPKRKQSMEEEDEGDVSEDEIEGTEEMEEEPEEKDEDYDEKATQKAKRKRMLSKEKSMRESEDEEEPSPKKSKVQKEKREPTQKATKEKKPRAKAKVEKVKEPSDEELKAAISELLQNADFSKVTFTDVMKQLGEKFNVDLTHKKSHLKALIQEEIARLVGEGEDEDSNTEGGDEKENSKQDQEELGRDNAKENEDGVGGDVKDQDDHNGKGEETGDADRDEEMDTAEDKAGSGGKDEDAQAEADDAGAEGTSADMA